MNPIDTKILLAAVAFAGLTALPLPGEARNVSTHAVITCSPAAGMYENPDPRRQIRALPFGARVGYRGALGEWARIEAYGRASEGYWGFVRRACVGRLRSW